MTTFYGDVFIAVAAYAGGAYSWPLVWTALKKVVGK